MKQRAHVLRRRRATAARAASPLCSIRPRRITTTCVASSSASCRSCVTSTRRHRQAAAQRDERVLQLGARDRVERAERLVEQNHRRLGRERARDRHALPLAAGQLARPPVAEFGRIEADERQRVARSFRRIAAPSSAAARAPRFAARASAAAARRPAARSRSAGADCTGIARRHVVRRRPNHAAIGIDEPIEAAEQRRLSGAALADQRNGFAGGHRERHVIERHDAPEPLRHASGGECGVSARRARHPVKIDPGSRPGRAASGPAGCCLRRRGAPATLARRRNGRSPRRDRWIGRSAAPGGARRPDTCGSSSCCARARSRCSGAAPTATHRPDCPPDPRPFR